MRLYRSARSRTSSGHAARMSSDRETTCCRRVPKASRTRHSRRVSGWGGCPCRHTRYCRGSTDRRGVTGHHCCEGGEASGLSRWAITEPPFLLPTTHDGDSRVRARCHGQRGQVLYSTRQLLAGLRGDPSSFCERVADVHGPCACPCSAATDRGHGVGRILP
jgi:hypothetical protein